MNGDRLSFLKGLIPIAAITGITTAAAGVALAPPNIGSSTPCNKVIVSEGPQTTYFPGPNPCQQFIVCPGGERCLPVLNGDFQSCGTASQYGTQCTIYTGGTPQYDGEGTFLGCVGGVPAGTTNDTFLLYHSPVECD